MLDKKYEEILLGIQQALKYMNDNYGDHFVWTSVEGYRIMKLGNIAPNSEWFPKIDWLINNGYIKQGKPSWCDMTQSYVETYGLTAKGSEYIEEMDDWKEVF